MEAIIAGLGFYLFLVHMLTSDKPFIPPKIFKDIGFLSGSATMFAVGIVLLGSSALLPPYLQNLGGYSVVQTGLLMTPRGIGAMVVMMIAGKLTRVIDPRLLMGAGVIAIGPSTCSWIQSLSGRGAADGPMAAPHRAYAKGERVAAS